MFFALNFVPYRIKTYLDGHEKTNPPAEPRHGVVPVGTRSRACACGRSLRDGGSRSAAGHPNAAAQTRPSPADTLHVVFFTDIHVTPGNAQDSLFRVAVAEANASDAELVIFGGDLTNTGSDEELEHVYGLMSQLEKPWFTVMGNHETTWSESGCTTFRCIFGHDGRVAYRAGGYLFLGYNCGPYMKMADGVVRTETSHGSERRPPGPAPANGS